MIKSDNKITVQGPIFGQSLWWMIHVPTGLKMKIFYLSIQPTFVYRLLLKKHNDYSLIEHWHFPLWWKNTVFTPNYETSLCVQNRITFNLQRPNSYSFTMFSGIYSISHFLSLQIRYFFTLLSFLYLLSVNIQSVVAACCHNTLFAKTN